MSDLKKGEIHVGSYSDGSGPVVSVSFDVTREYAPRSITIETGSQNWLGVEPEYVDELCEALKLAAQMIRRTLPTTQGEG